MKRIRDRVAGIDVHRDRVVACCRVVDSDGEVEVTRQSLATTRKGLGELAAHRGHDRGDGGDWCLLEEPGAPRGAV